MDELHFYNIHPSHDAVDVADVSYFVDVICRYCNKTDDDLGSPCELNPDWQVQI